MKQQIMKIITDNNPVTFNYIKKQLNLFKPDDLRNLNKILSELIREEKIYYRNREERYYLKTEKDHIGIFCETRHSYSFIDEILSEDINSEVEEKISYFTPEKFSSNALDGDTVKFRLVESTNRNGEKNVIAKVLRILKRNGKDILAEVVLNEKNKKEIVPIDRFQKHKYQINNINDLEVGNFISAKFVDYNNKIIYLKLNEIISEKFKAEVDHIFVLRKNGLNVDFPSEVKKLDFKKLQDKQDIEDLDRIDLTKELVYTIDGSTSKDLDDAISIEKIKDDYLLKVHIADVSYYVEEGSLLDDEAQERANSIYLIDFVRPMLPKILSDDLCSLNPDTIKKTMTAEMLIDKEGRVKVSKVYRSTIISKYRLVYSDVDAFLEGDNTIYSDQNLKNNLLVAKELADILRKRKIKEGMIDFELPEIKVEINEQKEPIDIYNKYQSKSEKLIEDLMVVTNETISKFLVKHNLHAIFRIHPKPSMDKLDSLKLFARTIFKPQMFEDKKNYEYITNFISKHSDDLTSKDLANYIRSVDLIENNVFYKVNLIQTMEKARYETTNQGHYALGLENYLHFTSPIRRYPDLVVHRELTKILLNKSYKQSNSYINHLERIAEHASVVEKDSIVIERELNDIKKARYVEKFYKDKIVEGMIVNILAFGFFVDIENKFQGLVRFDATNKEDYFVHENKLKVSHLKTNTIYDIFSKVKVRIVSIDTYRGTIDMQLME